MPNNIEVNDASWRALLNTIRTLSADERRRLWGILDAEFGAVQEPTVREIRAEYLASSDEQARAHNVRISFQTSSHLAHGLQMAAQERHASIDAFLNELLATSLAILQTDNSTNDDTNSLTIRRELALASVAALGDFWDNEVDREWQDFQP